MADPLRPHSVNYVTETAKEWTAGSSKEANKVRSASSASETPRADHASPSLPQEVAKGHTDASLTDRASAGLDAVSDKLQEEKQ